MTAAPSVLEAHGIELGYGRREVLRGVDISVEAGEVVALLGPNGAGKTTLMKVLVGLLDPRAGTVRGPVGRHVGWVPQGGAVWQRLTVRENLELFARLLDLPGDPIEVARTAAEAATLEPWYATLTSDLSGGLRQRLNVAVGLLGDPDLLVLDEPTTGVDLVHRTAMFAVLRERAGAGCGVLMSTHSLEDAAIADRVVVVVGGRARYSGPLAGLADVDGADAHASADVDPVSAGLLRLWAEDHAGVTT
ncbi:MAG: transporter ATP-binding protein [Thermoleophilia bacterium]|nr:transporter ATP-binding protein [Thermoleophilia bacterium]